jgi:hypothetical protein
MNSLLENAKSEAKKAKRAKKGKKPFLFFLPFLPFLLRPSSSRSNASSGHANQPGFFGALSFASHRQGRAR